IPPRAAPSVWLHPQKPATSVPLRGEQGRLALLVLAILAPPCFGDESVRRPTVQLNARPLRDCVWGSAGGTFPEVAMFVPDPAQAHKARANSCAGRCLPALPRAIEALPVLASP